MTIIINVVACLASRAGLASPAGQTGPAGPVGPVAQLLKQRKSVLRAGALHDVRESLVPKNMPVKLNCVQRLRHTVGRVEVGLDVSDLELARKVEGSDVMKLDLDVLRPLEKSGSRRQLDSALIVHLEQRSNTRIHNL